MLVHELGQLGGTKEFFDGRCDRTDVNDLLRRQNFIVLNRHPLTQVPLHTGQTDANLVGQEFTNRTDTAVPQVVNIIHTAKTFSQVEEVAHFSQDICWRDGPNIFSWIGIPDNGHNSVWVCRCHNLEFLQENRFCQNSRIIWNVFNQVEFIKLSFSRFQDFT